MKAETFNPYIRYVGKVTSKVLYPQPVLAYDFRMIYIAKGCLNVELEQETVVAQAGELFVLPPKLPYRLLQEPEESVCYYIFNFDFGSEQMEQSKSQIPEPAEAFREDAVFSTKCLPQFSEPFFLKNAFSLAHSVEEMYVSFVKRTEAGVGILSGLMKYVLSKAMELQCEMDEKKDKDVRIEAVKKYICAHCGIEMSNQAIAAHFGYHPHHLNAIFLKSTKKTLHQYVEKIRVEHAKALLLSSEDSIEHIAVLCGFSDPSYFSKFFYRNVHLTPKQYRSTVK